MAYSLNLSQTLPSLLGDGLHRLAQMGSPLDPTAPPPSVELPIGAIIVGFLVSIGIQVMFGLWGKSKAEDHNVNPLTGFMLGFFFAWIGVMLVPVFRKDRIINTTARPRYQQPIQSAPNPIYTAGTAMSQNAPPPHAGPPQPMPPQMAPQQMPPQAPDVLVADESGYVVCPYCGSRAKAGRKACMSCGNMLPPVFDPNAV